MSGRTLRGSTAVVTGASRGIGAAIARTLGRDGARVVVNYLASREQAEMVVESVEAEGGQAIAVRADVTDPDEVSSLAETARRTFGPVGILVNNAGRTNERKPFTELTWDDYQRQIDGTLRSAFYCTRAFLPDMAALGTGRIVAIGTAAVYEPTAGSHAYITAKAGLVGLVRTLALEVGNRGITANLVEPGFVVTDRARAFSEEFKERYASETPLGRIGQAEDVAEAVAFLVSGRAAYITGGTIVISGGRILGC